jgi:hypothetical protein
MAVFITMLTGIVAYATSYARLERQTVARVQALALAEAGIDKATYQLNLDPTYAGETDTALGNGMFTISVTSVDASTKRITAHGYVPNSSNPVATRQVQVNAVLNSSIVSFHYAVQTGNGGFLLQNSSSINGNVYSGGSVIGTGGSAHCGNVTGWGNCIYGDIISAGAGGLVYGVTATSSVFAHTIGDATTKTTIVNDAHYANSIQNVFDANGNAISNTFPGSADKTTAPLPISDALITDWENEAAAGGTMLSSACDSYSANTNTCTITSNKTLGPLKIPFNLLVKSSNGVLTVTGPLWVVGNITLQTGPTIKMDASLGSQNVAIIADDPNNRNTSGVLNIGQSTQFQGSGTAGSYVFMVSWNTSGETGVSNSVCSNGALDAICMSQSSSALVAYASHGQITFSQSAAVKAATAYKIILTQTANITYDTGLPSTEFQTGAGGSWVYEPGTYAILP